MSRNWTIRKRLPYSVKIDDGPFSVEIARFPRHQEAEDWAEFKAKTLPGVSYCVFYSPDVKTDEFICRWILEDGNLKKIV